MSKFKRRISTLLIVAILTGLFGITTANAQQTDNFVSQNNSIAAITKPASLNTNLKPDNLDSIKTPFTDFKPKWLNKAYPYAHLEEPATIQGMEIELQDNVKFMPENTTFDIEPASTEEEQPENTTDTGISPPSAPSSALQGDLTDRIYNPGTNILKFKNRSFIPQKDKIYIDPDTQTTYKVIDTATGVGGVQAAVVKPRSIDVFESIYIPEQEIKLTKGNITDLAEGVTLVNQTDDDSLSYVTADASGSLGDPSLTLSELPPPDRSKKYHELNIPRMVLFQEPRGDTNITSTEQPKGKPTTSPTPTPHPEERDARGMESGESLSISVVLKGGKIRVYEPTLFCAVDWDGDFDFGFISMKVESELEVETQLTFEKEMCVRIYGYGIDWDSGKKFLGKRIAAHIGVGIYAVIGVNGEITITAKFEQAGTINGGVKGNFWPFLVGVPSGRPYVIYDRDKFETSISLNGKIHAWAYVGPQLTIDVLDFNLVTAQVWVGLEADAVIEGEASTEGDASLQLGLSADFVALFRAWLFNKPFEYYLGKWRLFEKVFSYKKGQMVSEDTEEYKEITPAIVVDADAYTDTIWGSVWYEDNYGKTNLAHIPVQIIISHNNGSSDVFQTITDVNGQFVFRQWISTGLLSTDTVKIKIDHSVQDGNKTIAYKAETTKPIIPSVPFVPFVLEADAFNDIVSGNVSSSVPCPGFPFEDPYTGSVSVIVESNGTIVARKDISVTDGTFSVEFEDPMVLSGGRTVYASINYEGRTVKSDPVEANLDNLMFNVDCLIGGRDASKVRHPPGKRGITVSKLYTEGTITDLKNLKPYQGDIIIGITFINEEYAIPSIGRREYPTFGWHARIPAQVHSGLTKVSSVDKIDDMIAASLNKPVINPPGIKQPSGPDVNIPAKQLMTLLPYSTFKYEVPSDVFNDPRKRVLRIRIFIEHEGLIKTVFYDYNMPDRDHRLNTSETGENILGRESNAIRQIINEKVESRVNWPDVMLTVGHSQMRVNGVLTAIDGRKNPSVMVVNGNVFVPIEAVVKALGGSVTYGAGQKLSITLNTISAECTSGSTMLKVNGASKSMTHAPFMTSGGTMMLPVSFLSDNLGLETEWSPETKTLSIWSAGTAAK